MRALVTGCAGFIGSHLVEALLGAGWEVLGVDAFTENYSRSVKEANLNGIRRHPCFRLAADDLCTAEAEVLDRMMSGTTHIFHLAAEPGVRGSWGDRFGVYLARNLLATQRVLEAATRATNRSAGAGHALAKFILASSSSVYGAAERFPTAENDRPRPVSPYGATKLAAEELALAYQRQYGIPVVALRLFTAFGPRQRPDLAFARFLGAVGAGREVEVYGDGSQARDFTFVDDVVKAMILTAAGPDSLAGEVLNVGTGRTVTVNEALELIGEMTGRSVRIRYGPRVAGDAWRTAADVTKLRDRLGFSPQVSLRDGLRAQVKAQLTALS